MGHKEGIPEREVHSNTPYLKKIETVQINNLTLHQKELEEQEQTKTIASTRKEIIKIQEELNDTETKNQLTRSMNPGASSLKR